MARAGFRHLILGVAATALLAGCVEGEGPFAANPSPNAATGALRTAGGQPQDVESPEVFQVTDTALWDGRPSLGGVWVASPDTTDPERVIMRNPANGKSVVGALFRRERDNPGPKLQISSDAAEALGLLAGQPAEINVTAMRRTEAAASEPEPEIAAAGAIEAQSATADAGTAADVPADAAPLADAAGATAVAAAALAAVDAGEASDAAVDPLADGDAAAAPAAEPARKTWRERRAEAKARRQAERAAKAAAAGTAGAAGVAPATAAIVSDVETMPLDATSTAASAEPAAPSQATIGSEVGTAAAVSAEAAPSQPEPAENPTAGRPIQIGFFSQEANAERAVAELAAAGVPATARREESNGKAYWTVTARGDAATLGKAKAAGFADAYFLK